MPQTMSELYPRRESERLRRKRYNAAIWTSAVNATQKGRQTPNMESIGVPHIAVFSIRSSLSIYFLAFYFKNTSICFSYTGIFSFFSYFLDIKTVHQHFFSKAGTPIIAKSHHWRPFLLAKFTAACPTARRSTDRPLESCKRYAAVHF